MKTAYLFLLLLPLTAPPWAQDGTARVPAGPLTAQQSDSLAADGRDQAVQAQISALEKEIQALRVDNESLRKNHDTDWFIAGATAILVGILIGLIVPRVRWRRKSWNNL